MKQDRNVKKENWKKKPAAGKQGRSLDDKFEEWVGEKTGKKAGKSSEQKIDQKITATLSMSNLIGRYIIICRRYEKIF